MTVFSPEVIEAWCAEIPELRQVMAGQETCWFNPATAGAKATLARAELTAADIEGARLRLARFQPLLTRLFPETTGAGGIIESPLVAIPAMQRLLFPDSDSGAMGTMGRLLLKCDHLLPISGSIKARGGIYEVLHYAEQLALGHGLLASDDDYGILAEPHCRTVLARHRLAVGSTGNLGLGIGIMGAALGFQVIVHMSADARAWKKELLRSHGVEVVEYRTDYGAAVEAGRQQAAEDALCHFIDDEHSRNLFLGYAVAGRRLAEQLAAMAITVDRDHPLFVYLPCGVGGGPGGVTFGLKHLFGDDVHCFFAEPTHSPCMLLGLATGLHEQISVEDFGLDNHTAADGLAVGRPSGFVGRMLAPLIDGVFTVDDATMYRQLSQLADSEDIFLEPSAAAGLAGIGHLAATPRYLADCGLTAQDGKQATHVVWATGGSMVPPAEMARYCQLGKAVTFK
ncbi:MAG: D-serine ammonia-lyase [Desulfopila sp.]